MPPEQGELPPNRHLIICLSQCHFAYESDGREYPWYLPYNERLQKLCRDASTEMLNICVGPQQEFCKASDVDIDAFLATYTPREEPPALRPRANGRVAYPAGYVATVPDFNAAGYQNTAKALYDQEDLAFEVDDNSMTLTHISHTTADGYLKKTDVDKHKRPDFVSFYTKATRKKTLADAPFIPWLIVELKPPEEPLTLNGSVSLEDDGFGIRAKWAAQVRICKAIDQALLQVGFAFDEYPQVYKLAVLIGSGPFFDFFVVNRPKKFKRGQRLYLTTLDTRQAVNKAIDVNARPMFSADKKSFHPDFERLWNMLLTEFRL